MKITDEFLVKGYYRNYDGMHLLNHLSLIHICSGARQMFRGESI